MLLGGGTIQGFEAISGPFPAGTSLNDPIRYGYNNQIAPRRSNRGSPPFSPRSPGRPCKIRRRKTRDRTKTKDKAKDKLVDTPLPELTLAHPNDPSPASLANRFNRNWPAKIFRSSSANSRPTSCWPAKSNAICATPSSPFGNPDRCPADPRPARSRRRYSKPVSRDRTPQLEHCHELERRPLAFGRIARNRQPRAARHPAVANRQLLRLPRQTFAASANRPSRSIKTSNNGRPAQARNVAQIAPGPTVANDCVESTLPYTLKLFVERRSLFDALAPVGSSTTAADGGWEYQPYRVHAIWRSTPPAASPNNSLTTARVLTARVDAALAPAWSFRRTISPLAPNASQVFNTISTVRRLRRPPICPPTKINYSCSPSNRMPTASNSRHVNSTTTFSAGACRSPRMPSTIVTSRTTFRACLANVRTARAIGGRPRTTRSASRSCRAAHRCRARRCAALVSSRATFSADSASHIARRAAPGERHLAGTLDVHRSHGRQRQENRTSRFKAAAGARSARGSKAASNNWQSPSAPIRAHDAPTPLAHDGKEAARRLRSVRTKSRRRIPDSHWRQRHGGRNSRSARQIAN